MRIISPYKDFYDGVAQWDTDQDTIFVRKTGEPFDIEVPKDFMKPTARPNGYDTNDYYDYHVIFFAGKYYPIFRHWYWDGNKTNRTIVYDSDAVVDFWNRYDGKRNKWGKYFNRSRAVSTSDSFFDFYKCATHPFLTELATRYGPIFGIYSAIKHHMGQAKYVSIIQNPVLAPLGFASVVPPAIAYNELQKFVYNMARPARPIPEMSNETKIALAGFDTKYSFRKPKK